MFPQTEEYSTRLNATPICSVSRRNPASFCILPSNFVGHRFCKTDFPSVVFENDVELPLAGASHLKTNTTIVRSFSQAIWILPSRETTEGMQAIPHAFGMTIRTRILHPIMSRWNGSGQTLGTTRLGGVQPVGPLYLSLEPPEHQMS